MSKIIKGWVFLVILFGSASTWVLGVTPESEIRELDARWEKSLLEWDTVVWERILHPDFVWIHNHKTSVEESKADFLKKRRRNQRVLDEGEKERVRMPEGASRVQEQVKVVAHEHTAVVYGFTTVTKSDYMSALWPNTNRSTCYHFMRTYTKEGEEWMLLGNQTMAMPEAEIKK